MKRRVIHKILAMMMTISLAVGLVSVPVWASDVGDAEITTAMENEGDVQENTATTEDADDQTDEQEKAAVEAEAAEKQENAATAAEAAEEQEKAAVEAEVAEEQDEKVTEDSVTMKAAVSTASCSEQLSGKAAVIYNILKDRATQVTNGEIQSTEFTLDADEIFDKDAYYSEDLGTTVFDENGKLTDGARAALFGDALDQAVSKLIIDCPYELFWFNKTAGVQTKLTYYRTTQDDGIHFSFDEEPVDTITFRMAVSSDFGSGFYVDAGAVSAANKANANARAIVEKYKDKSDTEKLEGYKDEILDLCEYTSDMSGAYGKKSQIISVFDGCKNTTVLCEAYAKAFQYLCDLTTFSDSSMKCILVSGTVESNSLSGTHMWNIIVTGNGNYLMDVTNTEAEAVGAGGDLCMTGAAGSVKDGYTVTVSSGTKLTYKYDEDTLNHYSETELTLVHKHTAADPVAENKVEATCTTVSSYDKVVYCKTCGEELSREKITGKALGHVLETTIVDPGCTTDGYILKKCMNCDYEKKTILPNYGGHSWGSGVADKYGNITYTCTVCGETKSTGDAADTDEMKGYQESEPTVLACKHSYGKSKTVKAATCGENGLRTYTCKKCGYVKEETIKATGKHKYGSYVVTEAATVFAAGSKVATCKVCGAKKYASIKKLSPTISLSPTSKSIKKGQTFTLKVSKIAKGDSIKSIVCSNEGVVQYENGLVTGIAKGSATITVQLASGKKASCKVKVK